MHLFNCDMKRISQRTVILNSIVVCYIITIATTSLAQEEPVTLTDGPGPFTYLPGCIYPDFDTLDLDLMYDACLPLEITKFDEDDPMQPNLGTTAEYYSANVLDRLGEHVNLYHPSGIYSALERPIKTKHPTCLCRPNPQKLIDIFKGSGTIPEKCIDNTIAITKKYANSYDESLRIVLPSTMDDRDDSMAYAMMEESNTFIGDKSCVDMKTAAQPFNPRRPLAMPNSPSLKSYASSASTIQEFAETYLLNADQATLDRMFRNAGLHPTGNIPKGCVPGYLIGSRTGVLRASIATWDGKCFLANNTMWNYSKPKKGPNNWSIPGQVIPNSVSYFDGNPTTTIAYPRSDYWIRMSQLITGFVQDPTIFHDEVREIPDMPGFFLGQVHLGNVTEDRSILKPNARRTFQLPTGQRVTIPNGPDVPDPRDSPQSNEIVNGDEDAMGKKFNKYDSQRERNPIFYFAVFQVDNYPAHCIEPCENFV